MRSISIFLLGAWILLYSCESEPGLKELKQQYEELKTQEQELLDRMVVLDTAKKEIKQVNVTVKSILPDVFVQDFSVNGTVQAVNDAYLSPETPGKVEKIYVQEGSYVKKGQMIYSLNAGVYRNTLAEAKTGYELAKIVFDKQSKLWNENKIGSEIQYLEAKTKKESAESRIATLQSQIAMTQVLAPFAGVIDQLDIKVGEIASPGLRFVRIVGIQDLEISVDMAESYIGKVKKGTEVNVKFPHINTEIMAKVKNLGNVIHPLNRTFKMTLGFNNKEGKVKPNAIAMVKIVALQKDSSIVIPAHIIQQDQKGDYLFKSMKGKAKKQYIEIDQVQGNKALVVAGGLKFGDQIIVDGFNQLVDNTAIKIVENGRK